MRCTVISEVFRVLSSLIQEPQAVTYARSIKISDTAKGIRLDVHVYDNETNKAIEQAFTMYLKAQQTARDNHITLAPVEYNGISSGGKKEVSK